MKRLFLGLFTVFLVGCDDTVSRASRDAGSMDGGPEAPHFACSAERLKGLSVSDYDLLGSPPYALSGCQLLYVSAGSAQERKLVLRDLEKNSEEIIARGDEQPRRPHLAGPKDAPARVITWEATLEGKDVVRVRHANRTFTVSGDFDHAGEPRASEDAVVFTGFLNADPKGDSDVFLWESSSSTVRVIAEGPGQQRFATLNATHVAITDFAEDPDGRFDDDDFDVANIALISRTDGQTVLHDLPGKQGFPMFSEAGNLVYLEWSLNHPEPKLASYVIRAWQPGREAADLMIASVYTSPPYVRPGVTGELVEWVSNASDTGPVLQRAEIRESPATIEARMFDREAFVPVSNQLVTVLATRVENDAPVLDVVSR